jgi:hypothetical protein
MAAFDDLPWVLSLKYSCVMIVASCWIYSAMKHTNSALPRLIIVHGASDPHLPAKEQSPIPIWNAVKLISRCLLIIYLFIRWL